MTIQKTRLKRILCYIVFAAVIFTVNFFKPENILGASEERNVLLICSYNESYPSTRLKIDGVKKLLDEKGINLDIEYMDSKKSESSEYQHLLYEMIKYKLDNYVTYDVIMVSDDNATQFAINHRHDLFDGLPVVFLAVNNIELASVAAESFQMTGVAENLSVTENIELGLTINPEATKVIAIIDDTMTGKADKRQFLAAADAFKALSYKLINSDDYTLKELKDIFAGIDNNSIVLYMSMNRDKDGNTLNIKDNAKLMHDNIIVPVLRAEVGGVGDGIFGGKMVDYTEIAEIAAQMAVDIINGIPIEDIEVDYDSHTDYLFDYKLVKEYGISEKLLPQGSVFINKELSPYSQYKTYFLNIAAISGALTIILLIVIIDNRKRRNTIKKLKDQDDYIEHIANYDDLTDLPNKTLFYKKLCEEIKQGHCGTIMMLDIDNFNSINDTLGHAYGDEMIREIAVRLSGIDSDRLYLSRFGGDEFSILIMEVEDRIIVEDYVRRINNVLRNALIIKGRENFISFSIGITRFPFDGVKAEQLLVNADTAMYRVKHSGKNNYMFYENRMLEEIKRKIEVEAILRIALKDNGFYLVYQPQVNTATGEIIAFEGLLRLKDYDIPPNVFIPVAEESGLIIEIGRWVAKEAIKQLASWRDKDLPLKPIAVNYSNKQLQDVDYSRFLLDTLNEYSIDPKYLEIEITESILLEKTDRTFQFLNDASDLGINFALDDFGSGFSSINYLTFIPVYKIKIDKTMCDRFLEPEANNVINDLISLVHNLGLEITAEGIERIEQYHRLREVGCDYIQGYLFGRPTNVEEIERIYHCNMLKMLEA